MSSLSVNVIFTLFSLFEFSGCLESTGVELYGVHRNSTIHVESPPTNCSDPIQNENTGIFLIEYNCMVSFRIKSSYLISAVKGA